MSEETIGAQKSVPYAIILSVVVSAVMGYVFLLALLLSIQVNDQQQQCHCSWGECAAWLSAKGIATGRARKYSISSIPSTGLSSNVSKQAC